MGALLVVLVLVAGYAFLRWRSRKVLGAGVADPPITFEVDNDGLTLRKGASMVAWMRWEDIRLVRAFKVDCYTYDSIYFAVESVAEGGVFVVNEDHWQFKELVGAFEARLPQFDREWFLKVAIPAFETCDTVLYRATQTAAHGG
jgi:hypothetical protein